MRIMRLGFVVLFAPCFVLNAQGTVRSSARTTATWQKASPNACDVIASPSPEIVRTPEGIMLLRLKKEFDGVASVVEQRGGTLERVDVRRLNEAQRDVDSLLKFYVRGQREGANAPRVEITLRDLSSQFTGFANVTMRAMNTPAVSGYLGVGLSGSQIRLMTDSGMYTTHCDLPVVETVDVGSPARRAGLEAGDTVMAYNGRDILVYSVNYPQLLVPGNAVRIRVRREGKSRELPVTVGELPSAQTNVDGRGFMAPRGYMGFLTAPRNENVFFFQHLDENSNVRVRTDAPSWSNAPGAATWSFETTPLAAMSGSVIMGSIWGAQLSVIDEAFATTLELEPGVLVMRVAEGSPSALAGLKPGEMIRAVNGVPVRELSAIRRAVATPGVRDAKLTVTGRDTPARIVTVRW